MYANKLRRTTTALQQLKKYLRRLERCIDRVEPSLESQRKLVWLQKRITKLLSGLRPFGLRISGRPAAFAAAAVLALTTLPATAWSQVPRVTQLSPSTNAINVIRSTNISIRFSTAMDLSTVSQSNIRVFGSQTGLLSTSGSFSGNPERVFDPASLFRPGERISVTISTGASSTSGSGLTKPLVYQFRTAVSGGVGVFTSTTLGGRTSHDAALGDLDGDGDLDAIIANLNAPQDIWLNNGDGTFAESTFGSGLSHAVALGDLDGDGDLDALVANTSNEAQEVWLNNGDGTFTSSSVASGRSEGVALGDLDGDGDLDAIIATDIDEHAIYFNKGDATFSISTFGESGTDVALGDLDGDGDLDAAIANRRSGGDQLWLNNGDGTFTSSSMGSQSRAVAMGDLDDDGKLDIVFVGSDANDILLGNGDGTFSSSTFGDNTSYDVSLGDLDGDGDLDAIIANYDVAGEIWLNNGDGTFSSSSFGTDESHGVAIGDLDDDGDLDAIITRTYIQAQQVWLNRKPLRIVSLNPVTNASAAPAAGDISITFNQAMSTATLIADAMPTNANLVVYGNQTGHISTLATISYTNNNATVNIDPAADFKPGERVSMTLKDAQASQGALLNEPLVYQFHAGVDKGSAVFTTTSFGTGNSRSVVLGDLDGDGDVDAIVGNFSQAQEIWLNNGDGTFVSSSFGDGISNNIALGDLDGDGDLDAVFANYGDYSNDIWINNGDATFSSRTFSTLQAIDVALGDLDGDGDLDAVLSVYPNLGQAIWLNNGDATFISSSFGDSGESVALGDLDNDGDLDIVLTNDLWGADQLWLNNGDATFSSRDMVLESENVALGDLDGDGDLDAITATQSLGQNVWLNNGDGTFTNSTFGGEDKINVKIGDLDGDGDLDAILLDSGSDNELWLNNGDATFTSSTFGDDRNKGLALGDLDGDGDLDAVIARNMRAQQILLNQEAVQISSISPATNASSVAPDADIEVTFNQAMSTATLIADNAPTNANLIVYGNQSGHLTTKATITYTNGNATVVIGPAADFYPNELLSLTIREAESTVGTVLQDPQIHQFRAAVDGGIAEFNSTAFGSGRSRDVAIGDLDSDGDLDAIIVNSHNDSEEIWLNNGDGSFVPNTFGTGSRAVVEMGDVDGDGDLDALVAGHGASPREIWLNNGDGSFVIQTFGTGPVVDAAIGDLDGDGDLDAILTSYDFGEQKIWLNNGDGTFVESNIGTVGFGVKLGDLDGDGDLDAIIAEYGNSSVAVFHNNGDATFVCSSFFHHAVRVDLGDLDGDGDLDALLAEDSGDQLVWLNNGDGTFVSSTAGNDSFSDVSLGDLDGDNDLDAVFTAISGRSQKIWLNNGDATFETRTFGAGFSRGLALGDLDNDGDLDAIIANFGAPQELWFNKSRVDLLTISPATNANSVAVDADIEITFNRAMSTTALVVNAVPTIANVSFYGQYRGLMSTDASVSFAASNAQVIVNSAKDFKPGELISLTVRDAVSDEGAGQSVPVVHQFRAEVNKGSGAFNTTTFGNGQSRDVAIGDLDGDGDLDAIIATVQNSGEQLWLNNGDGTFVSSIIAGGRTQGVALGDLDGDSDLDAILARGNSQGLQVLLNNGSATFISSALSSESFLDVELGDLDGDGDLDAIATGPAEDPQEIWLNNGDGTFSSQTFGTSGAECAIGDLDGDGDLDVVVANYIYGQNQLWLNNGNATFVSSIIGGDGTAVSLGDLDGDGDLDAIVANPYGRNRIFTNNGDATFTSVTFGQNVNSYGLDLGDLDGDGDLDAVIANNSDPQEVWLNNGDGSFSSYSSGGTGRNYGLALGDLDGDGDLDAIISHDPGADEVWFNKIRLPQIVSLSPNSTTASLSGMQLTVSGNYFSETTAQITTLDQNGSSNGTLNLNLFNTSFTGFSTEIPAGFVSTAGTIVLTVSNPSGSTSTNITVLNDQPQISTTQAMLTIEEDQSTQVSLDLVDVWPGVANLNVIAPQLSQATIASIQQIGATSANTRFLVNPATNASGTYNLEFTADDGEFTVATTVTLVITPVNDPPTIEVTSTNISANEDQQVTSNLIVSDVDTPFSNLILTATSSNQSLVTNGGISFGATGANTTLFVDPLANTNGTVLLTVNIDDGEFQRSTSFTLTVNPVNDPPEISTSNTLISTNEDTAGTTSVDLFDSDTPLLDIVLRATSSNQSVLPNNQLSFGVTSAVTSLFYNPAANAGGSADITVSADDGEFVRSTTFTLTVLPQNDPPEISTNSVKISTDEAIATSTTVDLFDIDTDFSNLILSATSNNPSLLQTSNIVFSATAANVQLTLTPECGQTGDAIFTVSVSDGQYERSTAICLSVVNREALQISGATRACPAVTTEYTALPLDPTASYLWSVEGGVIAGGQGTASIDVIWDSNPTNATIDVVETVPTSCTRATQLAITAAEAQALQDFILVSGNSGSTNVVNNDLGSNLSIVAVEDPLNGSVVTNATTVIYTPDPGFTGIENFSYTVQSPEGCQATGAIVAVTPSTNASNVNIEYVEVQKDRVASVRGLRNAISTVVSPDGEYVYVAGRNDNSIALFERSTSTGTLNYLKRVRHGVNGVSGIKYVSDLVISPDGTRLYAAGYAQNATVVFERDLNNGDLIFVERKRKGQIDGDLTINGMKRPRGIAVSPDGQTVVASGYSDNSIAIFRFNELTGSISFIQYHKNGIDGVDGLKQAIGLAFSLDGKHLYVAGSGDDAIAVFDHDLASGLMTYNAQYVDGVNGIDGLDIVSGVAVSPDGKHVYTSGTGDDAVAAFSRNAATGSLTFVDDYRDGSGGISGLDGVNRLVVSPDGAQVWAAAQSDDAVVLFKRDQSSGELTFVEQVQDGTNGFDGLNGAYAVALDPHSQYAYVAGYDDDAVAVLSRNHIPVALDDAVGVAVKNTTLTIKPLLNDSDSDNHTLTIESKTNGALGTVSISGGGTTLSYAAGATIGADSFTYSINDGHGGSSSATVHVNVVAAKSGVNNELTMQVKPKIWISPNPAKEEVQVQFELEQTGIISMRIVDLLGNEVSHNTLGVRDAGTQTINLSLRDASGLRLSEGTYLIEIHLNNGDTLVGAVLVKR